MVGWKIVVFSVGVFISGCAVERAQVAQDAQNKMIGMSKEQLLACMGPPMQKATEGVTEVWAYNSGNDHTTAIGNTYATAQGSAVGGSGYAYGNASGQSASVVTSARRNCTINIVMTDNRVSRVNYSGATGGLLTQGEQCAFAIRNCVQ